MAKSSGRYFDSEKMRARLAELDPVKVADELAQVEPLRQIQLFCQLEKGRAEAVFQCLDAAHQEQLLEDLDEQQSVELVESLDPDDRARLFDELPAADAERLLNSLSSHERFLTQQLLSYPAESAGRIMTKSLLIICWQRNDGFGARFAKSFLNELVKNFMPNTTCLRTPGISP